MNDYKDFFQLSSIRYYLSSILTILNNFNILKLFLLIVKKNVLITLRDGRRFYIRNLLDLWTLKEVLVDDIYHLNELGNKMNVVIDIGSALGDFSIAISSKTNKVYSYDLNTELVALMKKNLQMNHVANVLVEKKESSRWMIYSYNIP